MPSLTWAAVSLFNRKYRPARPVEVNDPQSLAELSLWADKVRLRIYLPPGMLQMQGAFAYDTQHPFVQALSLGKGALEAFYARLRPRTLADYYGVKAEGQAGAALPPWELPWYLRRARIPPLGEGPLGPEHGVSFYGPVTAEKVRYEMGRLERLAASVTRNGYDPDAHGDIEGYILRDGDQVRFFVRGGKHRAAVLTHLGHDRIPVSFRAGFPRMVDAAQADLWPLVRSGEMDIALAQSVLRAYTRDRPGRGN